MASFSRLFQSFDPDPIRRGRQFERFVKWFLTVDPEWSTQVAQVWLWDEYPHRWGRDCGIDLVFKHKNGEIWAVQAKCYSPHYEITKADIDKFLSESNRKGIDHRLLIATTDRIGANAKQVCEAQEKSVVRYHLSHFEDAAVEYPDSIDQLALGHRKPPPEPRPYQLKAIEEVCGGFQSADRGQLIMACGTGKTLVSMWVRERLAAKRTLVLVPSLGLLSQIVNAWTSASREHFEVLCVCSDQTAGKQEEDETIISVSDLSFPVTSSPSEIATFLNGSGSRVVFSTYQSSPFIADALADISILDFDLIVADEAHRCAGKVDSAFATVLDSTKLRAAKRLFVTATPRTYSSSLKRKADEIGVEVVGMDDEAAFGKRFHTLPFGEAIRLGLLSDYRVVIVGVDDKTIANWIRDRRVLATETGIETDALSLAAEIGLIKAINCWDLRRIISFHSRVKRAERFAQELPEVWAWLDDAHKPSRTLWSEYVSGEMPTIVRRQKLQHLKSIGEDEIGLLSNARCLSEGVDVPALDCVAFIDARSSQIDIIQAVGRAIRLSAKKKMGTIVIPVFIGQSDDPEEALESSNFKPIWEVVDALRAHDDVLADELDRFRIELGSRARSIVGEGDLSKIVFDLPTSVDASFADALRTRLVEETTESWMFSFGLLQSFVKKHGHCRVPFEHLEEGYRLGRWVSRQRQGADKISPENRMRLDELGFDWDPFAANWEDGFAALQSFKDRKGHCSVPARHEEVGYKLGNWVNVQRQTANALSPERRRRLDNIGFEWDPSTSDWETGFAALATFKKREGHCRVPARHVEDGQRLGLWVATQRAFLDKMSPERKKRLDDIGFDWDPLAADWERGFSALLGFKAREGHCRAPLRQVEDGYKLGSWVARQRAVVDKMSLERKKRLDDIGFEWNPLTADWDEGFTELLKFKNREGHARVPRAYVEGDLRLGRWVESQRRASSTISPERKKRLDGIEFEWDPLTADWEEGFAALLNFRSREGHCRVRQHYRTEDGYQLGAWVQRQRRTFDKVSPERKKRLDDIGFEWDPLTSDWERGLTALLRFKAHEGHCRVPANHKEGDYKLGRWVQKQREAIGAISPERKKWLVDVGFVWHPLAADWEEGFAALLKFRQREGHCRVPALHSENGHRLGLWVSTQRGSLDKMSPERKKRLDDIGFEWDPFAANWERGFSGLLSFRAREGHCRVPQKHLEDGYSLGRWVGDQRKAIGTMPPERKKRLDDIGFEWDPLTADWEKGFASLLSFKAREGHCLVPNKYVEADYRLGAWVQRQRTFVDKMLSERKQRLDSIGFAWRVK